MLKIFWSSIFTVTMCILNIIFTTTLILYYNQKISNWFVMYDIWKTHTHIFNIIIFTERIFSLPFAFFIFIFLSAPSFFCFCVFCVFCFFLFLHLLEVIFIWKTFQTSSHIVVVFFARTQYLIVISYYFLELSYSVWYITIRFLPTT